MRFKALSGGLVAALVLVAPAHEAAAQANAVQTKGTAAQPAPSITKIVGVNWTCQLPKGRRSGEGSPGNVGLEYGTDGVIKIKITRFFDINGVESIIQTLSNGTWKMAGDRVQHSNMKTEIFQGWSSAAFTPSQQRVAEALRPENNALALVGTRVSDRGGFPVLILNSVGPRQTITCESGW